MNKTSINIGFIGFGTIGSGVIEIFNQNIDLIQKKVGKEVNLKKVVDLDINTDRGVEISSDKAINGC